MIWEVFGCIASVVVFLWAMATSPQEARCPTGWWIPEGVRSSGVFVCRPAPTGPTEREHGILVDHSVQPHGFIESQLHCPPPAIPVIDPDGRTLACRRL